MPGLILDISKNDKCLKNQAHQTANLLQTTNGIFSQFRKNIEVHENHRVFSTHWEGSCRYGNDTLYSSLMANTNSVLQTTLMYTGGLCSMMVPVLDIKPQSLERKGLSGRAQLSRQHEAGGSHLHCRCLKTHETEEFQNSC